MNWVIDTFCEVHVAAIIAEKFTVRHSNLDSIHLFMINSEPLTYTAFSVQVSGYAIMCKPYLCFGVAQEFSEDQVSFFLVKIMLFCNFSEGEKSE